MKKNPYEIIERVCRDYNLSRTKLAAELKVTRQTIHRWETLKELPERAEDLISYWERHRPLKAFRAAIDAMPPSHQFELVIALTHFVHRLVPHAKTLSSKELAAAIDNLAK